MRVLLVEDDQALAITLAMGLEAEGLQVERADTVAQAVASVGRQPPDLAIVDVSLPDGSGFSLIPRLRAEESLVLVLTARTEVSDRLRGFELGADDYMPKPFAFEELVARVRALTRRPGLARPLVLRCGDLELDLERQRVTRAGRVLDLTRKEYELLHLFLRNRQQVLGRDLIFERVWGYRNPLGGGTLDVYMSHLRHKLEEHGPRVLHTVRGIGYTLRCDEP